MTRYDITMGNDIARGIYCDIRMSNGIAICTLISQYILNDVAMSLFYYVLLRPIMMLLLSQ